MNKRLSPRMVKYIKDKNPVVDTHTHVFNYENVPEQYLGIRLPFHYGFLRLVENAVGFFGRIFRNETLKDAKTFVDEINNRTCREIFEDYLRYEKDSISVILMMDMSVSIKGTMHKTIVQQMEELAILRDIYPERILPYVAIDPNNPCAIGNFDLAFDKFNFYGVKIYPCLGYLPSHPTLMTIFRECEKRGIPITAHGSSASVRPSSNQAHIYGLDINGDSIDKYATLRTDEAWKNTFNHPSKWIPVLDKFPKLKVTLAHFCGKDRAWMDVLIPMMEKYENLRTDISFTYTQKGYAQWLKDLYANPLISEGIKDKILWGTDFYMNFMAGNYDKVKMKFIEELGDELFNRISRVNTKFLFE